MKRDHGLVRFQRFLGLLGATYKVEGDSDGMVLITDIVVGEVHTQLTVGFQTEGLTPYQSSHPYFLQRWVEIPGDRWTPPDMDYVDIEACSTVGGLVDAFCRELGREVFAYQHEVEYGDEMSRLYPED